jgi:hypothetical protein
MQVCARGMLHVCMLHGAGCTLQCCLLQVAGLCVTRCLSYAEGSAWHDARSHARDRSARTLEGWARTEPGRAKGAGKLPVLRKWD